ncbi:MAG: ABC transporter ATP-binding protein [Acidobacteria bacterium]|nr:ABC transporter ATP-binding protein [Acidobacteriota bacterium]
MKKILQTIDLEMVYTMGKVSVFALRGVNLAIEEREFVSIMGPSGCGKSTLLHIIGGMLTPTGGGVWVDGEDITRLDDARRTDLRRRKIGFVFQRFNLFPTLTVEGNLRLAQRIFTDGARHRGGEAEHARREEVLALLGLRDKAKHKPMELSGGEQQRVAIARAIINHPSILLADEPTGNLDSENSQMVLNLLRDLNRDQGQTIAMITHNPDAAAVSGRIIRMQDGHIVAG